MFGRVTAGRGRNGATGGYYGAFRGCLAAAVLGIFPSPRKWWQLGVRGASDGGVEAWQRWPLMGAVAGCAGALNGVLNEALNGQRGGTKKAPPKVAIS